MIKILFKQHGFKAQFGLLMTACVAAEWMGFSYGGSSGDALDQLDSDESGRVYSLGNQETKEVFSASLGWNSVLVQQNLSAAVRSDQAECVTQLLEQIPARYIDHEYKSKPEDLTGITPLHLAVIRHNIQILNLFLEKMDEAQLNDLQKENSPFYYAARWGDFEAVKLMLSKLTVTQLDSLGCDLRKHTRILLKIQMFYSVYPGNDFQTYFGLQSGTQLVQCIQAELARRHTLQPLLDLIPLHKNKTVDD